MLFFFLLCVQRVWTWRASCCKRKNSFLAEHISWFFLVISDIIHFFYFAKYLQRILNVISVYFKAKAAGPIYISPSLRKIPKDPSRKRGDENWISMMSTIFLVLSTKSTCLFLYQNTNLQFYLQDPHKMHFHEDLFFLNLFQIVSVFGFHCKMKSGWFFLTKA